MVPKKMKVKRTVDSPIKVRTDAEFIEARSIGGNTHLVFSRYTLPADVDRDIDSPNDEVVTEIMAEVVIPAASWEALVMVAASAISQIKRKKSEIDKEVKDRAEDNGEQTDDIL